MQFHKKSNGLISFRTNGMKVNHELKNSMRSVIEGFLLTVPAYYIGIILDKNSSARGLF